MSLTDEDLTQVRSIVVDTVTTAIQELILPRFDEHDRRFDILEADMIHVKEDIGVLKQDVAVLKEDVRVLKSDMREVKDRLGGLEGRVEAMEADIKELYAMVAAQKPEYSNSKLTKLSVEQKVLRMYEDVKLLAREAGVTLPN